MSQIDTQAVLASSPSATRHELTPTASPAFTLFHPFPTLTATPLPKIAATVTPLPEMKICSPLTSTKRAELSEIISDSFHPPPAGEDGRHQGVDFAYYRKFGRATIAGEGVQSVMAGVVAAVVTDRFPYGNFLLIETPASILPKWVQNRLELGKGDSLYVLYAHLAELYLEKIGVPVSECQLIGEVGKTGNAGVAHLHMEIRIGHAGQIFPSMAYYVAEATQEERETYLQWRTSGEFKAIDPMLLLADQGN
ncbi:MAG: hypothetical protein Kow0088_23040 [Anaerolineales bacterium]